MAGAGRVADRRETAVAGHLRPDAVADAVPAVSSAGVLAVVLEPVVEAGGATASA